jgi:hypothetical protein
LGIALDHDFLLGDNGYRVVRGQTHFVVVARS